MLTDWNRFEVFCLADIFVLECTGILKYCYVYTYLQSPVHNIYIF